MTKEDILDFLNKYGIKAEFVAFDEIGYSRVIDFSVYGIEYRIVWYVNESTLQIGRHNRAAQIPFKHIFLDQTFPLVGGNKSIAFSYHKLEKNSMWDPDYPYEVFRIPLEIPGND